MKNIGSYRGYQIYWSDPGSHGGTGEVMVGLDSVGSADSQDKAVRLGQRWIDEYEGRKR